MFNYQKKYYDLLEEFAEQVKENRNMRNAYNTIAQENRELRELLDKERDCGKRSSENEADSQ